MTFGYLSKNKSFFSVSLRSLTFFNTVGYVDIKLPQLGMFVNRLRDVCRCSSVSCLFFTPENWHIFIYRNSASPLCIILSWIIKKICATLQTRGAVACGVAVWMANCTELHHFLHQDTVLFQYTVSAQQHLFQLTRLCLRTFVKLVLQEMDCCIGAFFDSSDRDRNTPPEGLSPYHFHILWVS